METEPASVTSGKIFLPHFVSFSVDMIFSGENWGWRNMVPLAPGFANEAILYARETGDTGRRWQQHLQQLHSWSIGYQHLVFGCSSSTNEIDRQLLHVAFDISTVIESHREANGRMWCVLRCRADLRPPGWLAKQLTHAQQSVGRTDDDVR